MGDLVQADASLKPVQEVDPPCLSSGLNRNGKNLVTALLTASLVVASASS